MNDAPCRPSAAAAWAPLARFVAAEARIAQRAGKRPATQFLYEFLRFGLKQAWACLFGGAMVGLLIATSLWYPNGAALARYDFLLLAALAIQTAMLAFRLETRDEAKVIVVFHVVGTVMEIFKTSVGSWIYPEAALFHIGGVPLFSGFMYAAIGSYIARAWRLFDFRFVRHPPLWTLSVVSVLIYANFYLHHYIRDFRVVLFAALALLFGRTVVCYRIHQRHRAMPLLLGLFLVAVFIWIAENFGTLTRTWVYPSQRDGWTMVPLGKLSSWFLLMTISYVMVAWVNGVRAWREAPKRSGVSTARAPGRRWARALSRLRLRVRRRQRRHRVTARIDERADPRSRERGLAFGGRPAGEVDMTGAGRAQRCRDAGRFHRVGLVGPAHAGEPRARCREGRDHLLKARAALARHRGDAPRGEEIPGKRRPRREFRKLAECGEKHLRARTGALQDPVGGLA